MLAEKITNRLKESLEENALIQLIDDRGDGYHFSLHVISEQFEGKNRIQRSQHIYGILDDMMKTGEIHALQLKLQTPQEHEQR